MTEQSNHQLIEIDDPSIEPEQIMAEIRVRMRAERKKRGYDQQNFPRFGQSAMFDQMEALNIDSELYGHLQKTNDSIGAVETSLLLADSPATRLPVIGSIWRTVRANAHQLVLFYTNRTINQQRTVNQDVLDALTHLTILVHEQQEEIEDLRAELKIAK